MPRHKKVALPFDHSSVLALEHALDLLYRGKANAVELAAAAGVSKTDLQQVFGDYVSSHGLEPDDWQKDNEVSWPYIT